MAAKTTVSLPDDMHEWAKSQPDLNVSELLRNALAAEKAVREKSRTGDMAGALADRLQREGGKDVEDRHPEFYREGRSLAHLRLSRDELEDITSWYADRDFKAAEGGWELVAELANLTDFYDHDAAGMARDIFDDLLNGKRLTTARVEAFVKGIVDMWTEAKAQMEE